VNVKPWGANSYATARPASAVTVIVVAFATASGGKVTERPAAGIAITPPSGPMVFDTLMGDASGVARCSVVTLIDVLLSTARTGPVWPASSTGVVGPSVAHATAKAVTATMATSRAGREGEKEKRIDGLSGRRCLLRLRLP